MILSSSFCCVSAGSGEIDFEEFLTLMTNTEKFLETFGKFIQPQSSFALDVCVFACLFEFVCVFNCILVVDPYIIIDRYTYMLYPGYFNLLFITFKYSSQMLIMMNIY